MKRAALVLACFVLLSGCSTKLLRSEPAFDGRPVSEWRTLTLEHSYTDSTCAVLRLLPRVELHSVHASTNVYKRSWWPGDESFARTVCTPVSWIGGCLAGPILYLAAGYFDFLALTAIGPAVTVLIRTRLVFPTQTTLDTVTTSANAPAQVTVTLEGSARRANVLDVHNGVADLYLRDYVDFASPDSGIVLTVTSHEARGEATIHVPASSIRRARSLEDRPYALWSSIQRLEQAGDYGEALAQCQILLRDSGPMSLVARDSGVAERALRLRLAALDESAADGLGRLARLGLTPDEWLYVAGRLANLEDGVRYVAVTKGLGLECDAVHGVRYYSDLTAYQRLYAVLALAEKLASGAGEAQRWFVKRGFLKQWFVLVDIADKLAGIDSAQLLKGE